jgi:hypothetical protein
VDGRQPGGGAAPHRAGQVRPKLSQPVHPHQCRQLGAAPAARRAGCRRRRGRCARAPGLPPARCWAAGTGRALRRPRLRRALRLACAYSMPSSTTSRAAAAAISSDRSVMGRDCARRPGPGARQGKARQGSASRQNTHPCARRWCRRGRPHRPSRAASRSAWAPAASPPAAPPGSGRAGRPVDAEVVPGRRLGAEQPSPHSTLLR